MQQRFVVMLAMNIQISIIYNIEPSILSLHQYTKIISTTTHKDCL